MEGGKSDAKRAHDCAIFLAAIAASGQTADPPGTTGARPPEWGVASVKPGAPRSCLQGSGIRTTNDGLSTFCVPLSFVIETAYQVMESSRIIGMPEWATNGQRWNIDAKRRRMYQSSPPSSGTTSSTCCDPCSKSASI